MMLARAVLAVALEGAAEACLYVAACLLPDACPVACSECHTYHPPCALARKR